MDVITIQELANEWGLTYEAVRQQVAKYKEELKDHVNKTGGRTFLDQYAVDFIQSKRQPLPVVVDNVELKAELAAMRSDAEKSRSELLAAKEMIINLQQRINEGQKLLIDKSEEETKLVTDKIKAEAETKILMSKFEELAKNYAISQVANKELKDELDIIKTRLAEAETKINEQVADNIRLSARLIDIQASYSKTIFGLYKKKKGD